MRLLINLSWYTISLGGRGLGTRQRLTVLQQHRDQLRLAVLCSNGEGGVALLVLHVHAAPPAGQHVQQQRIGGLERAAGVGGEEEGGVSLGGPGPVVCSCEEKSNTCSR